MSATKHSFTLPYGAAYSDFRFLLNSIFNGRYMPMYIHFGHADTAIRSGQNSVIYGTFDTYLHF
jgi:hypothetical protein